MGDAVGCGDHARIQWRRRVSVHWYTGCNLCRYASCGSGLGYLRTWGSAKISSPWDSLLDGVDLPIIIVTNTPMHGDTHTSLLPQLLGLTSLSDASHHVCTTNKCAYSCSVVRTRLSFCATRSMRCGVQRMLWLDSSSI